jgi:hypothetical protein
MTTEHRLGQVANYVDERTGAAAVSYTHLRAHET